MIHHCPAVSDTRQRLPDAVIDWVVEESFAAIAQMHPAVHQVIPVAVRRWRTRLFQPSVWEEMLGFNRTLRADGYDCVIDTQGLLKSALIASRARGVKHGFDAASAREPLASRFYDVGHRVSREMHAVQRNRVLTAAALGIQPVAACDFGLEAPAENPISPGAPYCVLLSMTSHVDKLWPEHHWAELARSISELGLESVLPWGSDAEQARCRRVAEMAGTGIVPRRMSLGELSSVMNRAQIVFGVDTGLSHLAAALKVPTVGLFCGSDPRLTGLHGSGKLRNLGGPGQTPSASHAMAAMRAMI